MRDKIVRQTLHWPATIEADIAKALASFDDQPKGMTMQASDAVERALLVAQKNYETDPDDDRAFNNMLDDIRDAWLDDRAALLAAIEAMLPLFLYHKSGGHEGDGSDERIAIIDAALTAPAQTGEG